MKVVRIVIHPFPHQNFRQDLILFLELVYIIKNSSRHSWTLYKQTYITCTNYKTFYKSSEQAYTSWIYSVRNPEKTLGSQEASLVPTLPTQAWVKGYIYHET